MSKRLALTLAGLALTVGLPGPAWAQLYVASPPTTRAAPVYTGWQNFSFTGSGDSGYYTVNLPFTFTFFGKPYTSFDLTTDGLIIFENGTPKKCTGYNSDCSIGHAFPDPTAPNALIGFWWADMVASTTAGKNQWVVTGSAPARIFSFKMADWYKYSTSATTRSIQVDLHESSGAIEIFYGALAQASTSTSAMSVGIEDSTGAVGVPGLACSNATGRCSDANWPAGKAITFAPAIDPELSVLSVLSSALIPTPVDGMPGFQTDVTVKVQNLGQNAANGFLFDLYLCNQTTVVTNDPSKCVRIAQHTTPQTLAGKSSAEFTQAGVQFVRPGSSPDAGVPGPTGNTFYIGAYVDPPTELKPNGEVLEPIETNNTAVSGGYIAGVDLDGTLVGPPAGGPGDEAGLEIVIRNRGLDPVTTPFSYELWLATGTSLDRNKDKLIWPLQGQTATIDGLGAGESVQPAPPAKLPTTLADGTYRFILVIDPTSTAKPKGDVVEVNEANNTVVAPTPVVTSSADLTVENLKIRSVVAPYPEVSEAFFENKVRASVKLTNAGGATARNFDLCFYLSDTPLISPFDQQIEVTEPVMSGLTYVGKETHQLDVELTLPKYKKNNPDNGLLDDGQYYIGVIADCFMQVPEGNKSNNRMASGSTLKIRQPAADLAVIEVQAPAAAAVGEVMPVYRALRNLGILGRAERSQPGFPYRYYLSSNEIISAEDLPLAILAGSESKATGEVWLAPGDVDRLTDQVIIPWDISPGTYYVGLVLDPANEIIELDETNNGLLSLGTVEVAASSLRVETGALPDALVWVDYLQQLVATGGDGTYAWSLVEGQGELPAGLALSSAGQLSGRPEAAGVAAFTVKVVSAGRSALARLALRAVDASGPLTILSSTLPTAIVGIDYSINLAAIGGVRPYVWRLTAGELPAGLSFAPDGRISGRLAAAVGAVSFEVSATDAYGAVAVAELSLRGVSPNTVSVKTDKLKEALVGSAYQQNLEGQNGKEPYAWIIKGELPDGLRLVSNQIVGTPTRIGSYQVVVELTDANGFTDQGSFILTVRPKPSSYTMPIIPEYKAGDVVDLNLGRTAKPKTRFALYSGRLPPGLALAEDGRITGTVAADAAPGSYDGILEVNEESGATALLPLTLRVVAPEYVAPVETSSGGCSASGGGLVPLVALLGLLPLLTRRRRVGGAVLGAALAVVGFAAAPAHAGYRLTTAATAPFAPLINGTPVVLDASTGQAELTLPFGARLYGSTYGAAKVSCRGYLAFDKGSATLDQSNGIPSTSAAFPLIAPWWGRWDCSPDAIVWAVSGVAPRRVFTLQWTNVWYALDTTARAAHGATFQVKLHETTGKIEFAYGPSNQSAYQPPTPDKAPRIAVGIQSGAGPGLGGLSCTIQQPATGTGAMCKVSDYPTSSAITFAQPPDLVLARVYSDPVAYREVPLRLGATVHNQGGEPARNVVVRFYASGDEALDTSTDRLLGSAAAIDLDPSQKREVLLESTFPAELAGARYYLFAVVDPDNAVYEDDEGNNIGPERGQAFAVGGAIADLVVTDVVADRPVARAGETLWLTHTVRNIGNGLAGPCALASDCGAGMTCDAGRCRKLCTAPTQCPPDQTCGEGGFCDLAACSGASNCLPGEDCVGEACVARPIRYALYLSENAVITAADTLLTTELRSLEGGLAAFGESLRHDQVTLPAGLVPGAYHLGVIVSPEGDVPERLTVNNFAATAAPIVVGTEALSLLQSTLPAAGVQAPYAVQLRASGGDGAYQFALVGGALPAGLTLSATGLVSGIPLVATAAPAEFRVAVTSAGRTASATYRLEVQAANLPLVIISREIPACEYGKPCSVALSAIGGRAPYAWSANPSAPLPPGLTLAPDGRLEGVPTRDGEFTFKVEIEDAAANTAAQLLSLLVIAPDRLQLATRSLPEAYAGKPYSATVSVVGGRPPYTWAITEVRAVSTDPTALPASAGTKLPSALQFDSADKALTISGIPGASGSYVLTIKVSDPSGLEDNSSYLLNVRDERGLQVTTVSLPDAIAGRTYSARLAASVGEGTGAVAWSLACTQRYDETGAPLPCAAALPPGITLAADGTLSTPVVTDCHLPAEAPKGCSEGLTCSSEGRCVLQEPEGRPARTVYSFLVKAVEEKSGRTALRALSITLRVDEPLPAPKEEGGCSAAGGGTLLPAAAALLALLRRRRSGRAATALSAAGLVVAVGLAGLVGCGGGEEKPAPTRCDHVTCPETLSCDPGDGVCKCGGEGGMLCAAGGACSNGVCVYACPGAAVCTGGSALDPLDCQCKCGGKVCTAGQLCDTASRTCVTPDRCEGVTCGAGLACDPADGACKCGGVLCPQGQACVEGACTAGLCAGVQCAGATLCDPADGVCKCGGAAGRACSFGEACECPGGTSCEDTERRCAATGKCAGKVCGEGSSCDPADGVCRCGGPGGPQCLVGQTCDVLRQLCVGGNRCAGVFCGNGLTCDPDDGVCKCGGVNGVNGVNGVVCAPQEICGAFDSGERCVTACDPRQQQTCGTSMGCYFDMSARLSYCAQGKTITVNPDGTGCKKATDCARGYHCQQQPGQSGKCRKYCDPSKISGLECPQSSGAQECTQLDGAAENVGACDVTSL